MPSPRPLTAREREVLDAMLAPEGPGAERLRGQANEVEAIDFPDGRPSIYLTVERGQGMGHYSNATVVGQEGSGLVLWTSGGGLYALEWFGATDEEPAELPPAALLRVTLAS